jgi:hypothetical protein
LNKDINTILLQSLLFKQKCITLGFFPTREAILVLIAGCNDEMSEETIKECMAEIDKYEEVTDYMLNEIQKQQKNGKAGNQKKKNVKLG